MKCYSCNDKIHWWQRRINLGYQLCKYKHSTKFLAIGMVHESCLTREIRTQYEMAEASLRPYATSCYQKTSTTPTIGTTIKEM